MILEHYPYRFVKKDKEPWDGPQGFFDASFTVFFQVNEVTPDLLGLGRGLPTSFLCRQISFEGSSS